jgi:hypothetical protein
MLAILLLMALLVIRTGPESLLGQALRRPLVDWPAARLARLTRGQVICLAGVALLIWAGVALLGRESMQIMSMAMPDTLAFLATFDLSVLADALIAAALLSTQLRLRGVAAKLRSRLRRSGGRRIARARARRRARPAKADNDDDPAAGWVLAA